MHLKLRTLTGFLSAFAACSMLQANSLTLPTIGNGMPHSYLTAEEEAEVQIFKANMTTGKFTSSNAGKTWHAVWTSNENSGLTLNSGLNNMTTEGDHIVGYVGSGGSCTYTITAPAGYNVTGFQFNAKNHNGKNDYSLTLEAKGKSLVTKATPQLFEVSGLKERMATFTIKGGNKGVTFGDFTITIERSNIAPEPSFDVFPTLTPQAIPYRIPAIAKAQNGDIIAVADYRHSRADIGMAHYGRIDLHARISKDNGKTWGKIFPIVEGKGSASPDFMNVGFGDPCIVADRESSKVLVISCAGNVSFPNGTRENHQNIACFYSEDNGQTWSKPVDIAESIYQQFDKGNHGPVRAMFIGSGKISQSETVKVGDYYRLYCAALVKDVAGTNTNFVLYSDDFGHNWKVLGGVDVSPIPNGGDEPKAEELPDGSILISSRSYGGRQYNIFSFSNSEKAEGKWGTMAFSGSSNNGVTAENNSCNGEVLLVPAKRVSDNRQLYLLFQSLPFGSGRSNVGIYYKELERLAEFSCPDSIAANWDGRHQASQLSSAYSTMCWQADSTIGFLFEESTHCMDGGGYTIVYKNYSIEQLTDSAYTYCGEVDRNALVAAGIDAKMSNLVFAEGGYVGTLLPEGKTMVEEALQQYKAQPNKTHYEALNQTLANLPTVGIEVPRWYRLRNVGRQNASLYLNPVNNKYSVAQSNLNNADQYFTFSPTEKEGCFYIQNGNFQNTLGKLGNFETEPEVLPTTENAGIYQIVGHPNGQSEVVCTNKTGNNGGLHLAGDCKRLVPWTNNAPASLWYIEPIDEYTLNIPKEGYTTLNLPFSVELTEGLTAYTAGERTIIDGQECIYIEPVSEIDAQLPVIIEGEPGKYALKIHPKHSELQPVENNLLKGVLKKETINSKQLYLLNQGVWKQRTTTASTVAANTAYYEAESEQRQLPMTKIQGTPVGIEQIETNTVAPTQLFDLNGKKVNRPIPGIYVTAEGRKVWIKK